LFLAIAEVQLDQPVHDHEQLVPRIAVLEEDLTLVISACLDAAGDALTRRIVQALEDRDLSDDLAIPRGHRRLPVPVRWLLSNDFIAFRSGPSRTPSRPFGRS